MQSGGVGERLNASQITTALNSSLSTAVPEPSTYLLISLTLPLLFRLRRAA